MASNDDKIDAEAGHGRNLRFSSRENSAFKWKEDKSVVGAFEVKSEPYFDYKEKLEEKKVLTLEEEFEECLQLWKSQELGKSFIQACDGLPPETSCCGMVNDGDKTIQKWVPLLNKGWVKSANDKLKDKGYKISCFVWSWNNPSGKAQTIVMLIRFHSLTKTR